MVFSADDIRKSCRAGGTDTIPQDCFRLHGSREKMKPKLTDKATCYAIRQPEKGRGTRAVAEELGVTRRRIQRLRAEHLRTGKARVQRPAGRSAGHDPSEQEISVVMEVHGRKPEGVSRTAMGLHKEGHTVWAVDPLALHLAPHSLRYAHSLADHAPEVGDAAHQQIRICEWPPPSRKDPSPPAASPVRGLM